MNEKWNNFFDKDYYKTDKYSDYNKLLKGLGSYSGWNTYKSKREETPQERETRLLREKAKAREAKIDLILKK